MLSGISNTSQSPDGHEGLPPGYEEFRGRFTAESRSRVLESSSDDDGDDHPATASDAADIMKIAMVDFEAAAKRQTHLIIDNVLEQLQVKVNEKLIERLKAPSDTMTMESNATLRKAAANYETLYNELDTVFNRQKNVKIVWWSSSPPTCTRQATSMLQSAPFSERVVASMGATRPLRALCAWKNCRGACLWRICGATSYTSVALSNCLA